MLLYPKEKNRIVFMNCIDKIKSIITEYEQFLEKHGFLSTKWEEVDFTDKIANLPAECSEELIKYTKQIFTKIESFNEKEREESNLELILEVLIDAMILRKQPEVNSLIKYALLSDKFTNDDAYLASLYNSDSIEKVEISHEYLRKTESFDELGGYEKVRVIEYLTSIKSKTSWPVIMDCLFDVADRVKKASLYYFRLYGVNDEVVNKLKFFIFNEEDVDLIELAIEILIKWNVKSILPALFELKQEKWVQECPNFIKSLDVAVEKLQLL